MRYLRFIRYLFFGVLAACGGGGTQTSLPIAPTTAPVSGSSPTLDGFPVSIHEYELPAVDVHGPWGLLVGPDGAVWFTTNPLRFDRITGTGAIAGFDAPPNPPGNPEGTWDGFGTSVSYAGSIYTLFTCVGGSCGIYPSEIGLARVTMSGSITPAFIFAADNIAPFTVSVTTDLSGHIWIYASDYSASGFFWRYSLSGTKWSAELKVLHQVFGDGTALAFGPDGNLYAAASASGVPTIYKVSPTIDVLAKFQPPLSGPIYSYNIAFGADRALWIVDNGTDIIGHLTVSGAYTEYHVPFPGARPNGITEGSDGAIWFTDPGTNSIGRVTTAGVFSEFPVPTPGALRFGSPIISCPKKCDGAHGRVWFGEAAAHKIGRLEF